MDTLLELSKRHDEWLKMATKISGSSDKAMDLVQDMYLIMGTNDSVLREEYSNFIFTVMKNTHLNQYKKNNTFIQDKEVHKVNFVPLQDYNEDGNI
tara:strand:- start:21258 stop:21545 length:288 start_codon:yes stop_codon:yes gene_type:complete